MRSASSWLGFVSSPKSRLPDDRYVVSADYLAAMFANQAFCLAAERLAGFEPPQVVGEEVGAPVVVAGQKAGDVRREDHVVGRAPTVERMTGRRRLFREHVERGAGRQRPGVDEKHPPVHLELAVLHRPALQHRIHYLSGRLDPEQLGQVGQRVVHDSSARQSPYKFAFHVLADRKTVNAFALPGGPMFLNRGMIESAIRDCAGKSGR